MSEILFDPVDTIEFKDRKFCFTGKLKYGERPQCAEAVQNREGIVKKGLCKKTDYLVVGRDPSGKNYINKGKTKRAMKLKEKGIPILIVEGEVWEKYL